MPIGTAEAVTQFYSACKTIKALMQDFVNSLNDFHMPDVAEVVEAHAIILDTISPMIDSLIPLLDAAIEVEE